MNKDELVYDEEVSLSFFYLDEKQQIEKNFFKEHKIYLIYESKEKLVLGIGHLSDIKFLDEFQKTCNKEITILRIKDSNDLQKGKVGNDLILISNLLNFIIKYAISCQASDVHIEPFENYAKIRVRTDGQLVEVLRLSYEAYSLLVNRIKFLANMDIAEKRIPLDGKFLFELNGMKYDLRVSTIPTYYAEKLVLRILYRDLKLLNLNQLGMSEDQKKILQDSINKRNGIILVTGPTGSGKSSTLYSILNLLNKENINITTIEDPVEYSIEGINQININQKTGLTFSTGLRAILRQDPDVIMIGEIRDKETSEIAIRAAVTGHLVLSTFHTNDVFSTVTRLLEMKVEPYLLASALNLIIAQRLVRRVCPNCKEKYKPSTFEIKMLECDKELYKAKGCKKCNFTGYKGRIGIFELLQITDKHREIIVNDFSEVGFKSVSYGYKRLVDQCKSLVLEGITTFDEYIKITYLYS